MGEVLMRGLVLVLVACIACNGDDIEPVPFDLETIEGVYEVGYDCDACGIYGEVTLLHQHALWPECKNVMMWGYWLEGLYTCMFDEEPGRLEMQDRLCSDTACRKWIVPTTWTYDGRRFVADALIADKAGRPSVEVRMTLVRK
jgi:hypothetical protein